MYWQSNVHYCQSTRKLNTIASFFYGIDMFIIAYTCTFSSCANYHVSPSKYSTLQPLSKGETPQSQNKANLWTQMQPFAHQFVMQMCGPMSIPKVHKQNGRLHCKVIYKKIPHLLSPGWRIKRTSPEVDYISPFQTTFRS